MSDRILMSEAYGKLLFEAGIIPKECTRFIIDCTAGEPIKIYLTCNGTDALLAIAPPPALLEAQIITTERER